MLVFKGFPSVWERRRVFDFVTFSAHASSPLPLISHGRRSLSLRTLVLWMRVCLWEETVVMRRRTQSAISSSHTSKLLGPVSIKTAARRDAAALIHNETQRLAAAAGSPAKAAKKKTSRRINEALNSFFIYIFHSIIATDDIFIYYVLTMTQDGVPLDC